MKILIVLIGLFITWIVSCCCIVAGRTDEIMQNQDYINKEEQDGT